MSYAFFALSHPTTNLFMVLVSTQRVSDFLSRSPRCAGDPVGSSGGESGGALWKTGPRSDMHRPSFLSLLVLGLKHFEGTEFPKPLISKYLLPCKTAHQLTVRIKNRSMHRAPDNIFKVSAPHPARELRALRIPVPPTRGPPSSRLPGGAGLPSSSAASAAAVVGGLPAAWEMTP